MPYGTYSYVFLPLSYIDHTNVEYLSGLFVAQNVPARFVLKAHRARGAWRTSLPIGVFDNDFRDNACTIEQHVAARDRVYTAARKDCYRNQRPFFPAFDERDFEGATYYHPEALWVYSRYVEHPAFLKALFTFLKAAEKTPSLIVPPRPPVPFVPFEQRRNKRGNITRGADWAPEEDAVLRRWFAQRTVGPHAGRHVKLTDDEWSKVLLELPRRNQNSVRDRLVTLNRRLLAEMSRDMYIPQQRLPEYMARVLGERPRIPLRPKPPRRRRRFVTT